MTPRRFLFVFLLLVTASGGTGGCFTTSMWRWASRPGQLSEAVGSTKLNDGREAVLFHLENCPGHEDGCYAFVVPTGWRKRPVRPSAWGRAFQEIENPVHGVERLGSVLPEAPLASVAELSFFAAAVSRGNPPIHRRETGWFGVICAPGKEGFRAEVFGFHEGLRRWVHLGFAPMDGPGPMPGRMACATLLSPVTFCIDAALFVVSIVAVAAIVCASKGGTCPIPSRLGDDLVLAVRLPPNHCQIQCTVRELTAQLGTPSKRLAAAHLRAFGWDAMPAVPALRRLTADTDPGVRLDAAFTLSVLCPEDLDFYMPVLTAILRDGETGLRQCCALLMGNIETEETVSALVEALLDPDVGVRMNAATALGSLKSLSLRAVPALRRALGDESGFVRKAADRALWSIPGEWPVDVAQVGDGPGEKPERK